MTAGIALIGLLCLVPATAGPRTTSLGADRGAFPLVGAVVSGSGPSVGGGYRDPAFLDSPFGFEVSGLVSVYGYQLYQAQVGLLGLHGRALALGRPDAAVSSIVSDKPPSRRGVAAYLDLRYRYYPRSRFYGVGPASREGDRSDYLVKGGAADLVVQAQLARSFGLSARTGLLLSTVEEGHDADWPSTLGKFGPQGAPGVLDPPRYVVVGLGAAFDTRDPEEAGAGGLFLSAAAWRFADSRGDKFDFTRLAFDGRGQASLGHLPGAVATRLVVSADLVRAGAAVPFFLQASLGGEELLRGFGISRFQDRAVAQASIEYRLQVHPLLEVAPFLDAGTVAESVRALDVATLKASPGIGLRAHWAGSVLGRMDWAWGTEGVRVIFGLGAVF